MHWTVYWVGKVQLQSNHRNPEPRYLSVRPKLRDKNAIAKIVANHIAAPAGNQTSGPLGYHPITFVKLPMRLAASPRYSTAIMAKKTKITENAEMPTLINIMNFG